jgi:hypothetical protein
MDMPENTSKVLLDARENLDKLKRISYNVKTHIEPLQGYEDNGLDHDECQVLVRRDGISSEIIGEYSAFDRKGQKVIESSRKIQKLKLHDKTIDLSFCHPKRNLVIAELYFLNNVKPNGNGFHWNEFGTFLESRLDGHEFSVIDLMVESSNGFDYCGTENVKDIPCHIFKAATDYGVLKIWISPDYNFNILKWRLVRDRSHLFCDSNPLSNYDRFRNETQEFIYDRIENIEDSFIVTSGELRRQEDIIVDQKPSNRTLIFRSQRSDIKINPDFEALGAFKIDLPEGTILVAKGGDYDKYKIVNGDIVPFIDPSYIVDDDLNLRIIKSNQSKGNIK